MTVGLRGPVVGGWACLIDVILSEGNAHGLKLDHIDKRWIDLDGLGVRDLKRDGRDLLILAGPAMAVSGPVADYRWRGWADAPAGASVERPDFVAPLNFGYCCDHPEALLPLDHQGAPALLVLHDSPQPARLTPDGLLADIVALP